MRFLILTQYYPPETGAPQNRLHGLARELVRCGEEVSVLTAMPNYPSMHVQKGYRGRFFLREQIDGIPVCRAWIFASTRRSIVFRLMNYFSFCFTALLASFRIKGPIDIVLCESPPLFLGGTAWLISRMKGAKLIFNVSDLWPESAEKLGIIRNRFFLRMATALENFIYRRSWMITGQTQGIVENINRRHPLKPVLWLPNGVDGSYDLIQTGGDWRAEHGFAVDDFLILYAGIVGYAQGLDVLIEASRRNRSTRSIQYLILGEGPEKEKLQQIAKNAGASHIHFLSGVAKAEALRAVSGCDATVVPLRRLELFLGAIPSKIFESLLFEKPILLGVDGEARKLFIEQNRCGLYFEPEDPEALATMADRLADHPELCRELGSTGRRVVLERFTREKSTGNLLTRIREEWKKMT